MSPVAPCTQVGWGVVNMSNVMPIYNHLAGIEEIPARYPDVVACMNANQQILKPIGLESVHVWPESMFGVD